MITKFNRNKLTSAAQMRLRSTAAGYHWFKPDTLRFFEGKIESSSNEYGLFISSEQFISSRGNAEPRRYSVRQFRHDTGQVDTVGEFQEFASLKSARRAIDELSEGADELSTLDLQGLEWTDGDAYVDDMLVATGGGES